MKTNLYINGKDALITFGVTLADGGIGVLLTPPPSKDIITNESRLLDGKEIVNIPYRLSDRDISLPLNVYANDYEHFNQRINSLIEELTKGKAIIHTTYMPDVKYRLIYLSCTSLSQLRGQIGKIVVKFNEPNPTDRA